MAGASGSFSQQPMSLMTIEARGTSSRNRRDDEADLLTLRILEASERKMRLIRQLLTPEEYNSLASDLFTTPRDFVRSTQSLHSSQFKHHQSTTSIEDDDDNVTNGGATSSAQQADSVPANLSAAARSNSKRPLRVGGKFHSRSEAQLASVARERPASVQENLARRREAIDFFFLEPPAREGRGASEQPQLAIELRFGHYLNAGRELEDKLLRRANLGRLTLFLALVASVWRLIAQLCSRCSEPTSPPEGSQATSLVVSESSPEDEEDKRRFVKRFKRANCLPYTHKSNLLLMRQRLKSDGQLERVTSEGGPLLAKRQAVALITKSTSQLKRLDLSEHKGSEIIVISHIRAPLVVSRGACELSRDHDVGMLAHHPLIEHFLKSASLSSSQALGNQLQIKLRLVQFKLINQQLMSMEEKLALKLSETFENYAEQLERAARLDELLARFVEEKLEQSASAELANFSKCLRLIKVRDGFVAKVAALQEELEALWVQMVEARAAQGFQSTGLALEELQLDSGQQQTHHSKLNGAVSMELLERLQQAFASRFGQLDELDESQADQLERFQKQLSNELKKRREHAASVKQYRLQTANRLVTPKEELPALEVDRRKQIGEWLRSLRVRVSADGWATTSQRELRPMARLSNDCGEADLLSAYETRFNEQNLTLALPSNARQAPAKLQLELFSTRAKMFDLISTSGFQSRDLEAATELTIDLSSPAPSLQKRAVKLEAANLLALLQLEVAIETPGRSSKAVRSTVGRVYDNFFARDATSGREMATLAIPSDQFKLAKLINRVEPSLLTSVLGDDDDEARGLRRATYCVLDPFLSGLEAQGGEELSLRGALLSWRWLMDEASPTRVYLSERENWQLARAPATDLQLLRARALEGDRPPREPRPPAGYKSIELTRARALESIAQCEHLIEQLLDQTSGRQSQLAAEAPRSQALLSASRASNRLSDLLLEPSIKLNLVNFRDVAQALRLFVPRRTARRPLMPDRRRQRQRQDTKLGQLVELAHQAQRAPGDELLLHGGEQDLEQAAFGRWRGALAGRRQLSGDQLRLLVTIRQAQNVPLRVVPGASFQTRASTPLFPMSPTSLTLPSSPLFGAGGQQQQQQQQQAYLAPPTSYVEAVFQRKQLTSSLAQGKRPAWNETLFFGVAATQGGPASNLGGRASSSSSSYAHLVDEFLQLNLYDCRCYLQEAGGARPSQHLTGALSPSPSQMQPPAMLLEQPLDSPHFFNAPGSSLSLLSGGAGGASNRLLVSQRQRIERHLIGSLRLPLALLLSSGRIEGSFALNQPLLLDNYQFEPPAQQTGGGRRQQQQQLGNRTQLSLFITLDPQVSLPLHVQLPLESLERPEVFVYARFWEQLMLATRFAALASRRRQRRADELPTLAGGRSPLELSLRQLEPPLNSSSRHIRTLALGDDARYRLLSRYLAPLEPPNELLELQNDDDDDENEDEREDDDSKRQRQHHVVMQRLARFVSLLSPLKCGLFKRRLLAASVWFDARQLLEQSLGGVEEKAVLLCSYFLHLGKCCALLLCDALPNGRSVFVIVWSSEQLKRGRSRALEGQLSDLLENLSGAQRPETPPRRRRQSSGSNQLECAPIDRRNFLESLPILVNARALQLWDPSTGLAHALNDPALPLISVGSIVSCENIYASIQPGERPHELNYDIRQRNLWQPLFAGPLGSHEQRPPMAPGALEAALKRDQRRLAGLTARKRLAYLDNLAMKIGRPELTPLLPNDALCSSYQTLTQAECEELKSAIEQSIKAHLLKWRPNRPTYFNRTTSRLLAERLATYEQTYFHKPKRRFTARAESSASPVAPQAAHLGAAEQEQEQRALFADWRSDLAELIRSEVLSVSSQQLLTTAATLTASLASAAASQVISWPVNVSYTSVRSILDALYASGVHQADLALDSAAGPADSAPAGRALSTQFLVACHVEAYPARVLSVWLYVGAIVADQSGNSSNSVLV